MGIGTGLGIAGIASAGIGAGASLSAADTQANAANNAAQLQESDAQRALDFQKQQWATTQANEAPFLQAGTGAINTLSSLTSMPGQGLLTPWTETFTAPTAAEAAATPGYQFQQQTGQSAFENSAAASGGILSTGSEKGLINYAEGLAASNYQQQYQNALTQYQTAYNTFQNNQTNTFNRLAGVAGVGQTAATTLGNQGQAAAGNVANINLTAGGQIGQQLNNAGAATASGYVGAGNAFGGGINNIAGALTLQQLLAQNNNNVSGATGVQQSLQQLINEGAFGGMS